MRGLGKDSTSRFAAAIQQLDTISHKIGTKLAVQDGIKLTTSSFVICDIKLKI